MKMDEILGGDAYRIRSPAKEDGSSDEDSDIFGETICSNGNYRRIGYCHRLYYDVLQPRGILQCFWC